MKDKLKEVSMLAFVIHSMVSIRLITLPGDIMPYAKNNAWISVLFLGLLSVLNGYAFYWIAIQYPKLNFCQINSKVLGKTWSKVFLIGIAVYTTASNGLSLRLFSSSIKMFLLDRTPDLVIISTLLFLCSYCLIKGINTISIVFDLLLPIILLFFIILMALTFTRAEPKNLLPFWHGGITPILKGTLQMIDPALGCGIIAFVMPYFSDYKATKKWVFAGISVSILIYLLLVIMCILVFGVNEIQYMVFPSISLSKTIELKAEIFERTESLFMASWIPNTFTTIITFYLASTMCFKELFNIKERTPVVLGQIPLLLLISLFPKNIAVLYRYLSFNNYLAIFLTFIYVPTFVLIIILKRKKCKYNEEEI